MVRIFLFLLTSAAWFTTHAAAQMLPLPVRAPGAITGSAFAAAADTMSLDDREDFICSEILHGNVPGFLRTLCAVTVQRTIGDTVHAATYYVTPDYFAIGSDADHLRVPMTPGLAQRIADTLHCLLPTCRMVDDIYAAAPVKLRPQPIPPGPAMTTMRVFRQHNDSIRAQLAASPIRIVPGTLIAGVKKDVVITNTINNPAPTGRVAIYGWHRGMHDPIQPLYVKHADTWADYSHGIRLVQELMIVDGAAAMLADVLNDVRLSVLVSAEGCVATPRYPARQFPVSPRAR